ncbi:MAG TPA: M4 family metallopeptidase [Thermoanaerobaculia bacterium]|jgi:vibriolysin
MKKVLTALAFLTATVAFAKNPAAESKIQIKDSDSNGSATFVVGDLGRLASVSEKDAKAFLKAQRELLKATGTEDFDVVGTHKDGLGQTHFRFREKLRGLPVIGGDYIVHADASGKVVGMNGRFAADVKELPRNPSIDAWGALGRAASQAGVVNPSWQDVKADLVYVINDRGNAFLAWTAKVAHVDEQGSQLDTIYADATSGDLVMKDAQIRRARNRKTYSANFGTSIPGTLILQETTGTTTDVSIQKAHEYAGVTYDYFSGVHARDSFDNAGGAMISTVHYSSNYNNAGWTGTQMIYGDGDGSQFGPFSRALDVVAHELSHAVTERSANLVYQNESGALNEGTSDIFGAAAEAWKYGSVGALTWKIGEDCYTPATSGDALRYMNNPTGDGYSKDYYPERLTGTADYGGVHGNSGIANLAYYLMVTGGTHPRAKTTTVVPALNATAMTSINMGAKIWYRALTVYMTSTTNFAGARTATAQAATDLYGAAAADSVNKAWEAVGVGGSTGGGGTTTLTNGVAVTSVTASTGSWKHYKIAVPTGQTKLEIVQSGGTGDADLYVKRGAQPTSSVYDYRPYLNGNNETVTVTNPVAGDWYISIYAYSTFSGLSIKATYSTATTTCTQVTGTLSGTGAQSLQPQYVVSLSGAHTGKLTGPTGTDFDLYLQKLSGTTWSNVAAGETSTSTENVTYNGTAGTYRWRVYAYSGSGSFTLCTTKP